MNGMEIGFPVYNMRLAAPAIRLGEIDHEPVAIVNKDVFDKQFRELKALRVCASQHEQELRELVRERDLRQQREAELMEERRVVAELRKVLEGTMVVSDANADKAAQAEARSEFLETALWRANDAFRDMMSERDSWKDTAQKLMGVQQGEPKAKAESPKANADAAAVKVESFEEIASRIAKLVGEKQAAYGDSFGKSGDVLRILYPNGIPAAQYDDALCVTRILDKLFRIATDKDALGESPYGDIAGYGLLGVKSSERKAAAAATSSAPKTFAEAMKRVQNGCPCDGHTVQ